MKSNVQQHRRIASLFLVFSLTPSLFPPALLAQSLRASAAEPTVEIQAEQLASSLDQIKTDLSVLESQGKEAFLDRLFERLEADEGKLKNLLAAKIDQVGARRITMLILGIGSPVLAAMLAAIPEPWQAAVLKAGVNRFVSKSVTSVKGALVEVPVATLTIGLKRMIGLLQSAGANPADMMAGLSMDDRAWWEKFFGNSTIVRNFLITVVALAAIGVAVGLAIAGSTAAPIVAVVGALVSLIALIVTRDGELESELVLVR